MINRRIHRTYQQRRVYKVLCRRLARVERQWPQERYRQFLEDAIALFRRRRDAVDRRRLDGVVPQRRG